jgi:hypothetical protein
LWELDLFWDLRPNAHAIFSLETARPDVEVIDLLNDPHAIARELLSDVRHLHPDRWDDPDEHTRKCEGKNSKDAQHGALP